MLLLICTCMVLLYSIAFIFKMKKNTFGDMIGMVIVMVFVTFSSVTFGTILGVFFEFDITLSTIISMLYGLGLGYLVGRSVNLIAILEGLAAGTMGGMMGAMLGNMLLSNFKIMTIFITVLFIIITSFLFYIITLETGKKNEDLLPMPSPDKWIISATLSILIIFAAIGIEGNKPNDKLHENHNHSSAEMKIESINHSTS